MSMGWIVMLERTYLTHTQDTSHSKAAHFLARLAQIAVPVEHLMVNDWDNTPSPKVYIELPYPNRRTRVYKRFSDRDLFNAIQWYLREENL